MVKNQRTYLIYISGNLKNSTNRIFNAIILVMRKLLLISLVLAQVFCAGQGRTPVKVTDLLKIRSASALSLNKDGSALLFTVTSIEPDGEIKWEYKYVNQLWLAAADGSTPPRQLTTSRDGSSQGVFSPDGKKVAFVRTVDGKGQVFIISLDGGEATQLTRSKYGAGSPKWSPDGKKIIYSCSVSMKDLLKDSLLNPERTVPVWSLEKPGFEKNEQLQNNTTKADPDGNMEEVRAYLDNNAQDKKARVINKLNFQDEMDVNGEMNFTHFFVMEAKPEAKPTPITRGFFRFNSVDFSPKGDAFIISANLDSLNHPDRSQGAEIYMALTDSGEWRLLLGEKGMNFTSPRLSPESGAWIAYQYNRVGDGLNIPKLAFSPMIAETGTLKNRIDIDVDRNTSNIIWSKDEKYIYFSAQSNGGQPVYRADIKTRKPERLTEESSGVLSFDISANKLAYVRTEVSDPSEIYVADLAGKTPAKITTLNTEWLAGRQLSYPEKRSFVNEKGLTIEYWVMKPTNYKAGEKYPLLLEIHGGPSSMWGPGEASMWHEYQYFCSKGYGVVYSNPRGSGGYGLEFLKANVNDWGKGPASDVLTALDKTVSAEAWADTSRLLITGGSYAGYLVAWIIAHDQRFKAACSQRGVYDLATFFGEGNAWRLVPSYFGGYPWDPAVKATLDRESPINYVQNITTPYIIFHGDNDRRTGFVQSEMLYRSLKVLGRPVEYVRHPGGTHELTRSGNNRQRIDQMLRTYEFFERWINKK